MKPEDMRDDANKAIEQGSYGMTLVLPKGFKRPKGFPRGELLCEGHQGNVYSFKPQKIISWLDSLTPIEVER